MKIQNIIKSQYHAALDMLKNAVQSCPENLWNDPSAPNLFWQTAYHVLFYAHLYLQPAEKDFIPWEKDKPELRSLQPSDSNRGNMQGYTKSEVLEYLGFCDRLVDEIVDQLDLEGVSGFDWLPFNKLETQFYNIRHIQQHAGELYDRLGGESEAIRWVGWREHD